MRKLIMVALVAAAALVLSCNHQDSGDKFAAAPVSNTPGLVETENNLNATDDVKNEGQQQQVGEKQKQPQQTNPGQTSKIPTPDWDKKIIKNAVINIEVADYNKYYLSTREKIKSLGGYVAQEEQNQTDYKIENTMVVKVPVDQFDNAMVLFSDNVKKVNERKVSSQDVTGEVVDTRARIEARKNVRQRYMDLLSQAKNMEELLRVQTEVNNIQEEIEAASSRVAYLSQSASFSTINLTWYQVLNASAIDEKETSPSFGERIKSGFIAGGMIIGEVFLWMISIWPLVAGAFLGYVLYRKRIKKIKRSLSGKEGIQ